MSDQGVRNNNRFSWFLVLILALAVLTALLTFSTNRIAWVQEQQSPASDTLQRP